MNIKNSHKINADLLVLKFLVSELSTKYAKKQCKLFFYLILRSIYDFQLSKVLGIKEIHILNIYLRLTKSNIT